MPDIANWKTRIKKQWRAFNRDKTGDRAGYLLEFNALFIPALETFRTRVETFMETPKAQESEKVKAQNLLALLTLLEDQTLQKLSGTQHIDNRIVSLDEIDARPIKKGKSYPSCEFGTTLQMSFNRQGFMITTENFIDNPSDKTFYGNTLNLFVQRMGYPDIVVTDLGFRSSKNIKNTPKGISHVFLGRSNDVVTDSTRLLLQGTFSNRGIHRGSQESLWFW